MFPNDGILPLYCLAEKPTGVIFYISLLIRRHVISMLLNVYIRFRHLLKFVFLTLELLFSFPVNIQKIF